MKKIFRIRAIQLFMVLVVSFLCISCSHLNVDFDSSWSARNISVVVVEHEQAPEDVTTADIVSILTRLGWHVVADHEQAQARVVCRWMRQTDLTEESEPVEVVKSFHVQVISVKQPKILAVSDYFYSNNTEDLIGGVNAALTALTQEPVVSAPQAVLPKTQPVSQQSPVERITTPPIDVAQDSSVIQPVKQLQNDPETITVEEVSSVPLEDSPQQVLPMEPAVPAQQVQPLEPAEPVSMETSPWVPRFQGMGFDEWGKQ